MVLEKIQSQHMVVDTGHGLKTLDRNLRLDEISRLYWMVRLLGGFAV